MEADQKVAVFHNLNLNKRKNQDELITWKENFVSDVSIISTYEKNDFNNFNNNDIFSKELEFIKKHATDSDTDFLQSLLLSESNNPKRLETIMCNELKIPHALELIKDFRSKDAQEKRGANTSQLELMANKKIKSDSIKQYSTQIQEMFPDADKHFIINECQLLKSEEDFFRFINTVMISGNYLKIGQKEETLESELPKVVDLTNDVNLSDVIEITESNDSTHSYNPPDKNSLIALYEAEFNHMPAEENNFQIYNSFTSFDEEIDHVILKKKVSIDSEEATIKEIKAISEHNKEACNLNLEEYFLDEEKPLAEVIEERRQANLIYFQSPNNCLDSMSPNPSTSKTNASNDSSFESVCNEHDFDENEVNGPNNQKESYDVAEKKWQEEQVANLMRIFPKNDPSFLREQVLKMNMSSEAMNAFVIAKLERNDMPTLADYEKKKEIEELQNRYTKNFSIEDFLKAIPNPWKYFSEVNRNCEKYKSHSLCYLRSTFKKHYVRDIINAFNKNKSNLYLSYKELQKSTMRRRGTRRSEFECNVNRPTTIDIQFLQEVAFIENEEKIDEHLKTKTLLKKLKFEEAKRTGSLLECQCCFDSEVLVEDIVYCPKDHAFCKDCVIKCVEVEMGNGKSEFNCLVDCDKKFTLSCLQGVLKPDLFSKVIKANQMEEIRAAEIEDLVQCPFCNYATIMPPEQKVITCLNPECLKESCRLCQELSHVPLKCDEVEKSEEVKMRTYIENKMTEALVRTCYKCGKKFVKEDGCNKMTCTCGAKMCYICRKPVTDYSHFNSQGGTEYHKCPLYSTNDELHVDLVKKVGEKAKAKILQSNPQKRLIHDPTVIMPERTHDRPMPGMDHRGARNHQRRFIQELLGEPEEENDEEIMSNNDQEAIHNRQNHCRRRKNSRNDNFNLENGNNAENSGESDDFEETESEENEESEKSEDFESSKDSEESEGSKYSEDLEESESTTNSEDSEESEDLEEDTNTKKRHNHHNCKSSKPSQHQYPQKSQRSNHHHHRQHHRQQSQRSQHHRHRHTEHHHHHHHH